MTLTSRPADGSGTHVAGPPDPVPDWLAAYGTSPNEVFAFCREHALLGQVERAVTLARASFPKLRNIVLSVADDPETADAWVQLRVDTAGTAQEIMDCRRGYTREWVGSVSPPDRGKVRLSCNIV